MSVRYESFDVPVAGGALHVGRYGTGSKTLVAIHGITANHTSFKALAEQLDDFTVIAPDLRGRGRSGALPGPYGMAAHSDDVIAVLDHIGVEKATLLGWSMGGFVSIVTAYKYPDRVERLILVDGGIPLDLGPLRDQPVDDVVKAIIGPSLERLRMTFESLEAYMDFWRPHPALADDWNAYIEEHYTYDLIGDPPNMRSSVSEEAVLTDGGSELREPEIAQATDDLKHPALLIRAPRGLFNQIPPLYTDEWTKQWQAKLPTLRETLLPDVNHFTILLTERGAKAVADIVRSEVTP